MTAPVYLGIDIGTGSTKAVACTEDGTVLAQLSREHKASFPRQGWAEFDAHTTWWAEVCELAGGLVAAVGAERIAGVCVSGMGPCLVLTDEQLRPVRPAILYGIDTRAHREIAAQTERYGAETILEQCGTELSSQAVGPKVEWVRRHEPENFARATRILGLNSFVVAKLTGAYVQDHHSASQSDPLYVMPRSPHETGHWHEQRWREICGEIPAPDLVWPHEIVGRVGPEAARETGIPAGTPVAAGSVDAWVEGLSAGVREPGDVMLMYGSTMFITHTVSEFTASPGLWTTNGLFPGTLTLAAGMATSGSVLGWWQGLLDAPGFAELDDAARAVAPGADGLVALPYYAGERSPIFDPLARGSLVGLTLSHGRGHVIRAQYEGIGYAVRQVLGLVESRAEPIDRVVAVGGGAQSDVWTQAVSDITGREQEVPRTTIGASYGDALLAAIGTGRVAPDTTWARTARTVVPRAQHRQRYDELFAVYERTYPALREIMHDLARIQGQG